MGFSRQEYWSGLPCPPPGDLPNPGIEPMSLMSPAVAGRFFTTSTTYEALPSDQMVVSTFRVFLTEFVSTILFPNILVFLLSSTWLDCIFPLAWIEVHCGHMWLALDCDPGAQVKCNFNLKVLKSQHVIHHIFLLPSLQVVEPAPRVKVTSSRACLQWSYSRCKK